MNTDKITRYIIFGQLSFLASLVVCIILLPNGLAVNDGFSFFGGHSKTAIPFALGVGLMGWFYFRALKNLSPGMPYTVVRILGYFILLAVVINIVTPFNQASLVHWIHVAASVVIYSAQTLLAVWLVFAIRWDFLNVTLLCLLAIGVLSALLYLQPEKGFLLQAEVAYQITFALLFARSLSRRLIPPNSIPNTA